MWTEIFIITATKWIILSKATQMTAKASSMLPEWSMSVMMLIHSTELSKWYQTTEAKHARYEHCNFSQKYRFLQQQNDPSEK